MTISDTCSCQKQHFTQKRPDCNDKLIDAATVKTALSGNNVDLSGYVTSEQLQQTAQTLTNLVNVSLGDFYPKTEIDSKLIKNELDDVIFDDTMYSVEEYSLENLNPDSITVAEHESKKLKWEFTTSEGNQHGIELFWN